MRDYINIIIQPIYNNNNNNNNDIVRFIVEIADEEKYIDVDALAVNYVVLINQTYCFCYYLKKMIKCKYVVKYL
jgi:hypothetical protein